MGIFLKLCCAAVVPVIAAILFYILEKKTPFGRLPYWAGQLIIGVVFGAIAMFGTDFGVDVGGAVANARDASPLCAGLIFGGPAGIIAGVIGGVYRWMATVFGSVGAYSQLACSVSTVLAGLYAALLRKKMFDNKKPSWILGFIIGGVMEVLHLTILFLTHLSDATQAFKIVTVVTLPMVLCNAFSVMTALIAVSIIGKSGHKKIKYQNISIIVQRRLLICVIIAYIGTMLFMIGLQTNLSIKDASSILSQSITDVKNEVIEANDRQLLSLTESISREVTDPYDTDQLIALANRYSVAEIYTIGRDGIIFNSSNTENIGFDMSSGEQSAEFNILLSGTKEYVQEFQPMAADQSKMRKYAGIATGYGYLQAGYDPEHFQSALNIQVKGVTKNRHVGKDGYVVIFDSNGIAVSDAEGHDSTELRRKDFEKQLNSKRSDGLFEVKVHGEKSLCTASEAEGYTIMAVIPMDEVLQTRNMELYINSFMEILVFAALFTLIYLLIKKLVVNNIRTVNESLGEITGGNLDVTVDVRGSEEFASLSDDINSTVDTLKHYIDEAAARIDAELEFAKQIQHSALPSVFPPFPNVKSFDIYAAMFTAKEVGGDFYDFYFVAKNKIAFLIADVSGKGIPAAMFMMTAKTMLKSLAETGIPVNEVLMEANNKLCETNEAGMFVTVWMGVLNLTTGTVTFANAGHNPPVIRRADGTVEYFRTRPGLVLAGMDGVPYKMGELQLQKGDSLFLYTDGVTEATDANKQLFGEERLLRSHTDCGTDCDVRTVCENVKRDVDAFVGEAEQFDDITMLAIKYNGGNGDEGNNG